MTQVTVELKPFKIKLCIKVLNNNIMFMHHFAWGRLKEYKSDVSQKRSTQLYPGKVIPLSVIVTQLLLVTDID